MKEHIIRVDTRKCIGCGLCKKDCPAGNIALVNQKAAIITQSCIKCGHCVAICPKAAVDMTGYDEPPVEIDNPTVLDPHQLLDAIKTRRSVRLFTNRRIARDVLEQIVEAGRYTPTAGNAQNVSYIMITDNLKHYEEIALRLCRKLLPVVRMLNPMARNIEIDDHFFFKKAPAVILILSKDESNGALAASNMELMAEACGLGVLYSGFFTIAANRSRRLRKALGLQRKDKVAMTLVLGYSGVAYRRTAQKDAAAVRML